MEFGLSSIPIGVLKFIADKLEDMVALPAYKLSHQNYLNHKHRVLYTPLVSSIEYDLFLESKHVSNEEAPMSKLYVKVDVDSPYRCLSGYVIAKSGPLIYQNPIMIRIEENRESTSVYVCNLPQLPLKDLYVDDNRVHLSINDLEFCGTLTDQGGIASEFKIGLGLPLYEEFMNDDWEKKWGEVWCLTFLNREFDNYRFKFINKLAGPFALNHSYARANESFRTKIRRHWSSIVVNGICHEYVIKVLWWSTMKFRIKYLKENAKLD